MDRPNILLILCDDMGYSDVGCYGGEIDTPNIDNLASNGLKYSQFYNTARCSPSRASLLTGLHPHQTGIGILVNDDRPEGYAGTLNRSCVTMAEVLRNTGYETYMSGKWHLVNDRKNANSGWPLQRGFTHFYGTITGAANYFHPKTLVRDNENVEHEAKQDLNYYFTDKISDTAVEFLNIHKTTKSDKPFFLYVAYTAPHWPLHAKPNDIKKYKGRFNEGWDFLREKRLERMVELGLIEKNGLISPRDFKEKAWSKVRNKEWEVQRMETYAAQIDCMDQGIGRILETLKETNQYENTIIIFLSDNGGCAENLPRSYGIWVRAGKQPFARSNTKYGQRIQFGNTQNNIPGSEASFMSYGRAWANLSNTPFRLYKHWTHEGGVATPFIFTWLKGIDKRGQLINEPAHLPDVMATILELTGVNYPAEYHGNKIIPLEGKSLVPTFTGETIGARFLYFEHEGNVAVRYGQFKLVRDFPGEWELYNIQKDRTELHNLIQEYPEQAKTMIQAYNTWARRVGVIPRKNYFQKYLGNILGAFVFQIYRAIKSRSISKDNRRFETYWESSQKTR